MNFEERRGGRGSFRGGNRRGRDNFGGPRRYILLFHVYVELEKDLREIEMISEEEEVEGGPSETTTEMIEEVVVEEEATSEEEDLEEAEAEEVEEVAEEMSQQTLTKNLMITGSRPETKNTVTSKL